MLLKWRWRLLSSSGSLWVKVVKSIHGNEAGIDLGGCQTNGLWASIVDGPYSVSNIRKHIDDVMLPNNLPCTRWFKVIPKKINIFMWRFFMDRLPHRLNLSKRGLDIESILCPSCNRHVESDNHVFFSCDAALSIWRLVRVWCNSTFPVLNSCEDWDSWFCAWHALKASKDRAYAIYAASCWLIWRFCNNVTFNSQSMRKCDIFDNIRLFSFS
ncbi:RNA-directed DNA polymerase, eukaryota [Tanacetum coccineum]|uniref:RNA-directed DNA polymerase, eukaryota n=1 Tax=Tanacetum coccineum TaxID=301880 RepID=A0ABQ5AEE9_9ASTR